MFYVVFSLRDGEGAFLRQIVGIFRPELTFNNYRYRLYTPYKLVGFKSFQCWSISLSFVHMSTFHMVAKYP